SYFFFQAEDGIRDRNVTGVQTCALPIFIIKPPQASPLTAIKFMELVERAGFPKGVINVVTGKSSEITNVMMKDKRVRKITFTGSTAVGRKLIEQSAYQVKKLSLELGGHAPAIVFKDANIDLAEIRRA